MSWLPRLPKDQQVIVDDYRFTGEVTNWETVAYAVTNQWSARNGAVAKAAANIHAVINPSISLSKRLKTMGNVLLWVGIVVLLVLLARWHTRRSERRAREKSARLQ